jgi:hypothetical protein
VSPVPRRRDRVDAGALGIGQRASLASTRAPSNVGVLSTSPIDRRLTSDLHTGDAQDRLRDGARRDACARLACAQALDDVAHVRVRRQRAGEVGVPRPQARHRCGRIRDGLDAHDPLPVHGIAIGDLQDDGRAVVRPWRTPAVIVTASRSIRCRAPRPVAELPAVKVGSMSAGTSGSAAGAVEDRDEPGRATRRR